MRVGLLRLVRCLQQRVAALVCNKAVGLLQHLQEARGAPEPLMLVFDPLSRPLAALGVEKR
jgi:hypothetical protein